MTYKVLVTDSAEDDLVDIYQFYLREGGPEVADPLLSDLETKCSSLQEVRHRGHIPPELKRIGVRAFREVHCRKRFRVVYEIVEKKVYVHGVLDGRRDLEELLEHRVLR